MSLMDVFQGYLVLVSWIATLVSKILFPLLGVALPLKVYFRYSTASCSSPETMHGKTVIVTGGNSGIGKETAKELARRKARVIIACRNLGKANDAAEEIFRDTQQRVIVKHLDLASFKSVRNFVDDIVKTERRLDVLINNAGLVNRDRNVILTEDGCENCFQSNYLGPFLLTVMLAGLLKKSAPSRVINVSSIFHHFGSVRSFEEKGLGKYGPRNLLEIYNDTKKAQFLSTAWLARKLEPHGITVNVLHPGLTDTAIADFRGVISSVFQWYFYLFGKTPTEGAQTSVQLAVDPKLTRETGAYFAECKKKAPIIQSTSEKELDSLIKATCKIMRLEESELEAYLQVP